MTDLPRVAPLPARPGDLAVVVGRHRRRRRLQAASGALAVAAVLGGAAALTGPTPSGDSLQVAGSTPTVEPTAPPTDAPSAGPTAAPTATTGGSTVDAVVASQPIFGGSAACAPATGSTVKVGMLAHLSGVLSEMNLPSQQAAATFTSAMNACNGLGGHRVQVLVFDDQANPPTAREQIRELVDNERVIAFLGGAQPLTTDVTAEVLAAEGIPLIGSDLLSDSSFDQDLVFPQGSSAAAQIAAALDFAGDRKVGGASCLEIPLACDPVRAALTQQAGSHLVANEQTSVTAPDYRSRCRDLQAAGAEVVVLTLDPAAVARFTASCVDVGYRPAYALLSYGTAYLPHLQNQLDHTGMAGAFAPTPTFPWASSATAATRWYQQQQARFLPVSPGSQGSLTWTAGALLVAASGHLDAQEPTSAQLVRGLRELRGQASTTLGGLSATPLDLSGGSAPKTRDCVFALRVGADGATFSAPGAATCR